MKMFIAAAAFTMMSTFACAQEVRYANIVSVTPLTDNVQVIKQQCDQYGRGQEPSFFGNSFEHQEPNHPRCRNISTYEPTFGGFQVVYELDGKQYSARTNNFPQGKVIKVSFTPTVVP